MSMLAQGALLACSLVAGTNAFAQSITSDDRELMRQAATIYWNAVDSGNLDPTLSVPAGMTPLLSPTDSFWGPSLYLFQAVYKDRLTRQIGIEELIATDPQVRATFRHYTMTGELKTNAMTDHDGFIKIFNAGLDALLTEQSFSLENDEAIFQVVNGEVRLFGLKSHEVAMPNPVTSPTPINYPNLPPDIRWFKDTVWTCWNMLKVPIWSDAASEPDGAFPWGNNGVDCDDFADMLAKWLKDGLPTDATIESAWCFWHGDGHVILVIHYRGYSLLIDPQTGFIEVVAGDVTDELTYRFMCKAGYFPGRDCNGALPWLYRTRYRKPFERPFSEPPAWWYDPENVDRLRPILEPRGITPEQLIPTPDEIENWPVWVPPATP